VQEHVDVIKHDLVVNPQVLWQPSTGPETLRLLERSMLDEDGRKRTERQASAVLARCLAPTTRGEDPRTGLVVGYVQSGKTLSFTTVMALARDNGFPLVVLFAGTKDNLHQQTAARLAKDLEVERDGGMPPWFMVSNPKSDGADAQLLAQQLKLALDPATPAQFRRTVVVTVMKNPTRLNHLRGVLTSLGASGISLHDLPCLVIDDEADQAGLNTMVANDETSATYQAIVDLRDTLPNHSYVMYTATPQAPLLVSLADTLSPDFVAVLEPGAAYTGGEYFFEEHRDRFLETISHAETQHALDPSATEPPASLVEALATYFLGVAIRGEGPTSMLVHPSHTQDLHQKYAEWVKALCQTWKDLLAQSGPDRDDLVQAVFEPAYKDLSSGLEEVKPLDELLTLLPFWIGTTSIRVVNSDNPEESEIKWNVSPSWILVGGNKLDRGFTVEGLTVTYMPRGTGVGNADGIQQRARFFGYKKKYAPLCRAWLAGTTEIAFTRYVHHEKVLRGELQDVAREGSGLKQWKRRMLLDAAFKPCRRAVVDIPYLHKQVKGDTWARFERIHRSPNDVAANRNVLDAFLATHQPAAEADPRDKRPDHRNKRFMVPLGDLLKLLTDWDMESVDGVAKDQTLLLLRARLDDAPDLKADVYLMRNLLPRQRAWQADGVSVVNLFEGRRPNGSNAYEGDAKFFTDGIVNLQVHKVDVASGKGGEVLQKDVPALALWVPSELAGGVLMQNDA
jgi:hypothetical protein